jgi:diaminopropionate ammonia-lyase
VLADSRPRGGPFDAGLFTDEEYLAVSAHWSTAPEYRPSPLVRLPGLSKELGLGELLVKDESHRHGHLSFKALGVGYAVARLLHRTGSRQDLVLASATDGNHGHALARVARAHGLKAHIYVHQLTRQERIDLIRAEGADVVVVAGNYDDAVRKASSDARAHGWQVVSDTSWEGYTEVPRWIMAGYTQMLREAHEQWQPEPQPDVVIVQAGVGAFACAVASWFARWGTPLRPFLILCEPTRAACLLESAAAGRPTTVDGSLETIMDGLSCGEVSRAAWPAIAATADAYVAFDDSWAVDAMRLLEAGRPGDAPIETGASGAAGLAALLAILRDPSLDLVREASRLSASSRVLVFNTEGAVGNPLRQRP